MSPRRSLATAQTVPVPCDVDANLDAHLRLAAAAAEEGALVVVFPELSLTGYEIEAAEKLAFTEDDARLAPLEEAATAYGMTLVVGAPARVGPCLHIGAFVLAADGTRDLYTKRHMGAFSDDARVDGGLTGLPPREDSVFQPGDRDPLLRVGDATAAIAVCADANQAAHPQRAASRGADTYLASMFVIRSAYGADAVRLAGYAKRHRMAVVLSNYGAATGGLAAAGRSAIWSETGERLVVLEPEGAGIAVATREASGWTARARMLSAR